MCSISFRLLHCNTESSTLRFGHLPQAIVNLWRARRKLLIQYRVKFTFCKHVFVVKWKSYAEKYGFLFGQVSENLILKPWTQRLHSSNIKLHVIKAYLQVWQSSSCWCRGCNKQKMSLFSIWDKATETLSFMYTCTQYIYLQMCHFYHTQIFFSSSQESG